MKKFIYLLAGVTLSAAFTSCEDAKEPQYHTPDAASFTINTPALQDQFLATTNDMDNKETFDLFTSQPDYGFSAVCEYGVQMSLSSTFTDATDTQDANYITLSNQSASQSAMSFRTYDLAVAMTKLLGITDDDSYQAYVDGGGAMVMPVYFRATCRIPGVTGSEIVSSNVTSYNKVQFSYAIPKAGFIYICGHVTDPVSGTIQAFQEPSSGNAEYFNDFKLVEPVIGCKLYAGYYILRAAAGPADNTDNNSQWRFFTELNGWGDTKVQIASNTPDFYVEPITDLFVDGLYQGSAVYGQGNWGYWAEEETPMTFVVSLQDKDHPKVWYKVGQWDVNVVLDQNNMNAPEFVEHAE